MLKGDRAKSSGILEFLPVTATNNFTDRTVSPVVHRFEPLPLRLASGIIKESHHGLCGGFEHVDMACRARLRTADNDGQGPGNLMVGFVPAHMLGHVMNPNDLAAAFLATIPADIVDSMSAQMKEVLAVQAHRAEFCTRAGEDAAATFTGDCPTPREIVVMRAAYRAERTFWNEGGPRMHRTVDEHILAAGVEVPIRIHYPTAEAIVPAIVFLHGGGFTVGDLDTHDRIMRVIAASSGAAVIGVDFSLAPEARFPQALDETVGVIDHLVHYGHTFGIDGRRLIVAGDSAGAMLTMGAAILLRDDPESVGAATDSFAALRCLIMFYGGHGLNDSASRRLFGGHWDGMSPADLAALRSMYLTSVDQLHLPVVNHLDADLSGLPPVFITVAGLDPLRDDSRALSVRLRRAGTSTLR